MIRVLALGFIGLTLIYLFLTFRARWRCRECLEEEFDAGGIDGDRDVYIAAGLLEYQGSLRKKLFLGVYVVPIVVIGILVYVINFM